MSKICRVCKKTNTLGNAEACIDCRDFDRIAQNVWGNRKRLSKVSRKDFPKIGDFAKYIKNLYASQNGHCYYTDYEMTLPVKDKDKKGLGMMCSPDRERVDNGYEKGNIVLCIDKINTMKTNLSHENEFYTYCRAVTENYEKKHCFKPLSQKQIVKLVEELKSTF